MKILKELFLKIRSVSSVILVSIYPCLFMYFLNVGEIKLSSIEIPVITYLLVGIVLCLSLFIFLKDISKTVFWATIIEALLCNYVVLNDAINLFVLCNYIVQSVVLIIVFALGIFVVKKKKIKIDYSLICDIISIVLIVLLVIDAAMCAYKISYSGNKKSKKVVINQNRESSKNIYYLFFDEYAGEECLKYYYDYSNEDLYNELEKNNFSVIRSSHNYESIYTQEILPNILNLDYVATIDGLTSKNIELTRNSTLYEFLKKNNYDIKMVNEGGFLCDDGCEVIAGETYSPVNDEKKAVQSVFNQGFISLIMDMLSNNAYSYEERCAKAEEKNKLFDVYYNNCNNNGNKKFLIGYFSMPHEPFIFQHDGSVWGKDDNVIDDWKDKKYYIEQLEYINSQIRRIVDKIIKDDPNSIIIIQSDHGARYALKNMGDYKKSEYDEKKETESMQNVINCVYLGGEKIDEDGLSTINTWRKVLNIEFGSDLPMIDCDDKYIYRWKVAVE